MRSTFEDIEDGSTDSPSSFDGTATRRSDVMRPVREEANLASFSCDTKYRDFRFVDSEDDYGRFVDVKFSPDGKTVAALEKDGTLRLWDWATGRLQSRIEPVRDGDFRSFAFSPDGKQLLLQDTDQTDGEKEYVVFLIDTAAGKPIAKVAYAKSGARGNYARLRGVAFSPDGSRFAVGLSLWDAKTGKLLSAGDPKHHSEGDGVLFSPDGKYVLAYGLSHRNSVVLWDLEANEVTLPFLVDDEYEEKRSRNYTHAVALSKDGNLMVSTLDSIVRLWDFGQRRLLANLVGGGEHVSSVAFSPDATTVAATFYDGATMFWDVSTIEAAQTERPK
jgi:WD40 repeat protein